MLEDGQHELGRLTAAVDSLRMLASIGVFGGLVGAVISVRNATVLTRVESHGREANGRLAQVELDHAQTRGAQDVQDRLMRYAVLPALGIGGGIAATILGVALKGTI